MDISGSHCDDSLGEVKSEDAQPRDNIVVPKTINIYQEIVPIWMPNPSPSYHFLGRSHGITRCHPNPVAAWILKNIYDLGSENKLPLTFDATSLEESLEPFFFPHGLVAILRYINDAI